MSGIQGRPFRVILLVATILTLLATSSFSADIKVLRKQAEDGDAVAQYNLAVMYRDGQGTPKNSTEAVKWFKKAAEQGLPAAQYNLGVRYANGRGVQQDDAVAAMWFRKAAEQGDAQAQYNLGIMYDNGRGVVKDYAEAIKWYRSRRTTKKRSSGIGRPLSRGIRTPKLCSDIRMPMVMAFRRTTKKPPSGT